MIIAIRKEPNGLIYIDKTVINRLSEDELKKEPYNFKLIEVDKEDCCFNDFNDDLTFDLDKYNKRKSKEQNQTILQYLQNWFNDYTKYEQMLTRRAYLGIDDEIVDEFRGKTYKSLKDLYQEAEVVASEIKKLSK